MRISALLALAGLSLGITAAPLTAQADACSDATLKGAYGYQETLTQDNNAPHLFGETVGIMRFDGAGNGTSVQDYARSDGQGTRGSLITLTYSVTPDCRFTFVWANSETFSGVIVRNGEELLYIETSGTAFGTAIIRRAHAARIRTGT